MYVCLHLTLTQRGNKFIGVFFIFFYLGEEETLGEARQITPRRFSRTHDTRGGEEVDGEKRPRCSMTENVLFSCASLRNVGSCLIFASLSAPFSVFPGLKVLVVCPQCCFLCEMFLLFAQMEEKRKGKES